ncbi:hypothetical protein Landi51_04994 [Colletotrichum acutatum]
MDTDHATVTKPKSSLTRNISTPLPYPFPAAIPPKAARTLMEKPKSGWPAGSTRKNLPPWDRSIDIVYHKYRRGQALPDKAIDFENSVAMFFADHQRTQQQEPTSPYLRLPAVARFQICQHLIADHTSDMPICLNDGRFVREVWTDDEYTSLAAAMGTLQPYLDVSFALRADVLVAFLMEKRFHITLSPFVGPYLNPLATLWCDKYGHFMQHVIVELDLTRLGFGPGKEACKLRAGTVNMDDLIGAFVRGQLRRKNHSTLKSLVLLCRRFWGERPSDHLPSGSRPAADKDNQGASTEPEQVSAPKRSSYGADFSYCPDEFLRICEPFVRLAGFIDSMRLCGFSNGYTHSLLRRIFPVPVSSDEFKHHTYRVAPSSVWPRIPGQKSWVDKGHGKLQLDDHSRQYLRGLCLPEGAIILTRPYENLSTGRMSVGYASRSIEETSENGDARELSDSRTQLIGRASQESVAIDEASLEHRMQVLVHRMRRSLSKREVDAGSQASTTSAWAMSGWSSRESEGSWLKDGTISRATI